MSNKLPRDEQGSLTILKDRVLAIKNGDQTLDLSNIGLVSIPDILHKAAGVLHIDLSNNHLSELPSSIRCFKSLRSIMLDGNCFNEVPPSLQSLKMLSWLRLDRNFLSDLPDWISRFKHLHVLTARSNALRSVCGTLFQGSLKEIDLSNNLIDTVRARKCIGADTYIRKKRSRDYVYHGGGLSHLQIGGNRLSHIPECFMQDLNSLDVSDNPLMTLPFEWHGMRLFDLNLSCTQIDDLHGLESLAAFPHFFNLDISRNRFLELPASLRAAKNLKTLIAANNAIRSVPTWLREISLLEQIDFSGNAITKWPAELCDFALLTHLDLTGNPLNSLPDEMQRLVSLRELAVSDFSTGLPSRITSRPRACDVFISYASEDFDAVVHPLQQELTQAGLTLWIDRFQIDVGDSIRSGIDNGIYTSQAAVVIVSKQYINKRWTGLELNALFHKEGRLIPVWHNVSRDEVAAWSPMLVDRHSVDTSKGIAFVAEQIRRVLLFGRKQEARLRIGLAARLLGALEGDDGAPDIDKLILHNPEVLVNAGVEHGIIYAGPDGPIRSLCIAISRTDAVVVVLIAFAPPSASPFSEEVESWKAWLGAIDCGGVIQRVLVCGRRKSLVMDQTRLQQLNNKSEVVLRSYDWLVDACRKVDGSI